ncbi:Hpt domain-containing protein [Rhodocaloribacter litoris]|uniref:Hpt domain-containing protein n=1 Tax=Rhodocaloribacter litoris TaxID=2558931 RepID=UPI0014217708|nr:Hpt domain-containing protein [Rhodocaloribacter litoris]QXD13837.1 Hpt domain-containing protein [Rhodocaloribacter litoris]
MEQKRIFLTLDSETTPDRQLPEANEHLSVNLAFLEAHAFGNTGFIVKMIDLFMAQAPGLLAMLRQGRARSDWEQVRFVVHKMKSSARILGSETLAQALACVERQAARPDAHETLPLRIDQVATLYETALHELEAVRRKYV